MSHYLLFITNLLFLNEKKRYRVKKIVIVAVRRTWNEKKLQYERHESGAKKSNLEIIFLTPNPIKSQLSLSII